MLAKLKEKIPSSERDTRSDRSKVVLKSLLQRGRSLRSSTSSQEGRDDGGDEGRSGSSRSIGKKRGSRTKNVNEMSEESKSQWLQQSGEMQELDKFVRGPVPDSPTDVKDIDLVSSSELQKAELQKRTSIEGLREIAKNLSNELPRVYTAEEEEQLDQMGRRITLGQSVTDSVSESKILKKAQRKPRSLGPDDLGGAVEQVNSGEWLEMEDRNSSPKKGLRSSFHSNAPESSIFAMISPSEQESRSAESVADTVRQSFSKRMSPAKKELRKMFGKAEVREEEGQEVHVPNLTPCQGFLTPSDNLTMRSSELDPFPHQVEIPPCREVLMCSRLCNVLGQYLEVDQNFNFGTLIGVSPKAMKGFSRGKKLDGVVLQHQGIVSGIVQCADDLILEGFFHDDANEPSKRIEVAVFNSQALRQFLVVYKGTASQQKKPVRSKHLKDSPTSLHRDQPVGVFPAFREAYFKSKLETKVYGLLDRLACKYPFCDVVMTGHAFGGALATIASLRFASSREMIRVSCITFGSPRVGSATFRQLVNSLPNLKVMRVEHEEDQVAHVPDSSSWTHVGHTISVNPGRLSITLPYRFEKGKPVQKFALGPRRSEKSMSTKAYVEAIEHFATKDGTWNTSFVGENVGKGVRGKNNEERQVV